MEIVIIGLDELLLDLNVQQLYHSSQLVQVFHHRAQGTPIHSPVLPKPSPKIPESSTENSDLKISDVEVVVESTIEKLKKNLDEKADYIDTVDVDKLDNMIDVEYISSAGQYIRDISAKIRDIMTQYPSNTLTIDILNSIDRISPSSHKSIASSSTCP